MLEDQVGGVDDHEDGQQQQHRRLCQPGDAARQHQHDQDGQQQADGDVWRAPGLVDPGQGRGQAAVPGHAEQQAGGGHVVDQGAVGDGGDGDDDEGPGRKPGSGLLHDVGQRGLGLAQRLPGNDRDGGDGHPDVENGRDAHGQDHAQRQGYARVLDLFGDVQAVLEADKGEEGQGGALQHQQGGEHGGVAGGRRGEFQQVRLAPEAGADDDDQDQAAGLDQGADGVDPDRLPDAAKDDPGHQQDVADTQKHQGRLAEDRRPLQVLGDDQGSGGDGGQAREGGGHADHMGEQRPAERMMGHEGGAAGPGIARSESGIAEAGEQGRHEGGQEREPDRRADLPGRLADQAIDAGAHHAAGPVEHHLHRPDGAEKLGLAFSRWLGGHQLPLVSPRSTRAAGRRSASVASAGD